MYSIIRTIILLLIMRLSLSICNKGEYYCSLMSTCCPCDISNNDISMFCAYCARGRECDVNSIVCPPGTEYIALNDISQSSSSVVKCVGNDCCKACDAGTYNNEMTIGCQPCPNGNMSAVGDTSCYSSCLYGTGLNGFGKYSFKDNLFYYRATADNRKCLNCLEGTYNRGDSLYCEPCPVPYYGINDEGNCHMCPLGKLSYYEDILIDGSNLGSRYQSCIAYGFALSPNHLLIIVLTLFSTAVLTLLFLCGTPAMCKTMIGMLSYMLLPTANFIFNLTYFLSNYFVKPETIYTPVITPVVIFVFILWVYQAAPGLTLCNIPTCLQSDEYDSFIKLLPLLLAYIIHIPFYILWFILGVWLYMIKALPITNMLHTWLTVWTGQTQTSLSSSTTNTIEIQLLNFCICCQILFEAIPILFIQLNDHTISVDIEEADNRIQQYIRYTAIIFGLLSAFSGLYRILYFKMYKRIDLLDIPLSCTICHTNVLSHIQLASADKKHSEANFDTLTSEDGDDDDDIEVYMDNFDKYLQGNKGKTRRNSVLEQQQRLLNSPKRTTIDDSKQERNKGKIKEFQVEYIEDEDEDEDEENDVDENNVVNMNGQNGQKDRYSRHDEEYRDNDQDRDNNKVRVNRRDTHASTSRPLSTKIKQTQEYTQKIVDRLKKRFKKSLRNTDNPSLHIKKEEYIESNLSPRFINTFKYKLNTRLYEVYNLFLYGLRSICQCTIRCCYQAYTHSVTRKNSILFDNRDDNRMNIHVHGHHVEMTTLSDIEKGARRPKKGPKILKMNKKK